MGRESHSRPFRLLLAICSFFDRAFRCTFQSSSHCRRRKHRRVDLPGRFPSHSLPHKVQLFHLLHRRGLRSSKRRTQPGCWYSSLLPRNIGNRNSQRDWFPLRLRSRRSCWDSPSVAFHCSPGGNSGNPRRHRPHRPRCRRPPQSLFRKCSPSDNYRNPRPLHRFRQNRRRNSRHRRPDRQHNPACRRASHRSSPDSCSPNHRNRLRHRPRCRFELRHHKRTAYLGAKRTGLVERR